MRLGFCTMGYLPYCTLEDAIERIGRIGYECIDLWAYSPHLGPDHYDAEGREQIRRLIQRAGLGVSCLSVLGATLGMHLNISHASPKVRGDTVAYYKECVKLAKDVGSPRINMISGHKMHGTSLEQAWEWNRECIAEVAEEAERHDIQIALHTLTPPESEVIVTLDDALKMMNEVGSPNVKVMIDTADQNVTEPNLSDAVRKVAEHLVYVHCNDNKGEGRGDIHDPPGRGNINWRHFVRVLKEIGYDGDLVMQVNTGIRVDMDAWAWESYEYMSAVLADVLGGK